MSSRFARIFEGVALVAIAIAVLVGGRSLVLNLLHFRTVVAIGLLILGAVQVAALRRRVAFGGYELAIQATRDVAFLATIVLALLEVCKPTRWALGATIAAFEFGIVCELLARLPARA
ncbi:MAG: hypothetical protein ABI346_00075 [Candidatus Baltobacteraceae bacterium]